MKSTSLLMQLTAREFWQDCQWIGQKKIAQNRVVNWYSIRVKEVFTYANWSGENNKQPLQTQSSKQLKISLNVKDLFQCFAWDRQQKPLEPQKIEAKQKSQNSKEQSVLSELAELF